MIRRPYMFLLITAFLFSSCINVFKLTDLRTEHSKIHSDATKARQLLADMGKAHKIANWKKIGTYEVLFEDEFYGFWGKQGSPYKEEKMEFALRYIPGTFDGQLHILSGKEKGTIWGLQSWTSYTAQKGQEPKIKKDKDVEFWVPTYQYFIEFPYRIQEATIVNYAGTKEIEGIKCEGILASWNTLSPQKDIDQYLIWLDSKSKQIVKVEYTVRDALKFITGAATFKSYKDYNGILLPTEMPVESNLVKEGLLHTMRIKNFKADVFKPEAVRPLSLSVEQEKS